MAVAEWRLVMATSSHIDRPNAAFLSWHSATDFEKITKEIAHMLDAWRSRFQYRSDLTRLLEISPHLITDIGFEPDKVREDIAQPLWKFQGPMHSE